MSRTNWVDPRELKSHKCKRCNEWCKPREQDSCPKCTHAFLTSWDPAIAADSIEKLILIAPTKEAWDNMNTWRQYHIFNGMGASCASKLAHYAMNHHWKMPPTKKGEINWPHSLGCGCPDRHKRYHHTQGDWMQNPTWK